MRFNELIADEGRLSSRKFMEFGGWVAATVLVLLYGFRGDLSAEMLGLYVGVFSAARFAGQTVHAYRHTQEIRAQAVEDEPPPPERTRKGSVIR